MKIDSAKEERLIAAIAHGSILLPFIGIGVPLLVWLTQRERSALLRFQALQATVFQGISLALYVLAYVCQFGSIFGMFALIPIGALLAPALPPGAGSGPLVALIPICFSAVMLVFMALQCIAVPALMILGAWAALRTLGGADFHYPILGRRLAERLAAPEPTERPPVANTADDVRQ